MTAGEIGGMNKHLDGVLKLFVLSLQLFGFL